MKDRINAALLRFIEKSVSPFHTIAAIKEELQGYTQLQEGADWDLTPGGRYYVTRNGSTIAAFCIGAPEGGFRITASHSDSPCFKLKEQPLRDGGDYRLGLHGGANQFQGLLRLPPSAGCRNLC